MTDSSMPSSEGSANREGWRDIIVFGSMTVVAVALGVALHMHADVPPPIAAVAALAAQIVMVSAHLAALALFARPAPRPRRQRIGPTPRTAAAETAAAATGAPLADPVPAIAPAVARPAPERIEPVALPESAAETRAPARDILDIRPGEPWVGVPAAETTPVQELAPETAPNAPVASPEAIEQAIRGLAAVIPAERAAAAAEVAETAADVMETVGTAARAAAGLVETVGAQPPPALPVDAITQSVEALRSAASAMREPAVARAAAEEPAIAARRRLADIASAVERESIEVALTPVVRLDDSTLRQEIVTVGLVTAAGSALIPDDVAEVARTAGLLGLLEALKIGRAVRIAQTLEVEAPGVAVRCAVTGEALASERALSALVGTDASQPPAGRMVMLTFTADDARTFSADHWRTLSDLAALGLRFAITDVTTMEFDLAALSGFGIAALAIDFDVLARGVPTPEGDILPPALLVEQLGAHGLDLIATGVGDEDRVAFVAALGPVLAEGAAIALPRVVEDADARVAAA